MGTPVLVDSDFLIELQGIADWFRVNGFRKPAASSESTFTKPPILVHNNSGEAIPPYACMQVTNTEELGNNYIQVDKPADADGTSGGYLFNGPTEIEINGDGIAQDSVIVRALGDGGTATAGERWSPVANQWYIDQVADGPFIMCGEDDVATDCVRIFATVGGGGGGVEFFVGKLNEDMSAFVAECSIYTFDGLAVTDTTEDADAYDTTGFTGNDLITGDYVNLFKQNGKYYMIQGPCSTGSRLITEEEEIIP